MSPEGDDIPPPSPPIFVHPEEPNENAQLMAQCRHILDNNDGLESNIGVDSPYWTMMNQYRGIPR